MNALELADLIGLCDDGGYNQDASAMLRQQQAEIEALKADNGHYRDMAVDFLKCREPYGWHCFIGEQDFLFVNGKGASMPDASWDKVLPLYLHPSIQEQKDEQ